MNHSAICVGVACLALLTVPLKTAAQIVSVTVTKRAEEIEKPAHKIRTESEQYRYF